VDTELTGNCNLTRTHAAERLVEWVTGGATPFPSDDVLLLGDFNSYEEEDPIEVLVDAGFADLVQELGDDSFTYKFDGRYGRLDYAFASPSLRDKVTDAAVWQINSRAPVGYLYSNHPIDDSAHGSSDHDPVLVSLTGDGPGSRSGAGRGGR
jgi:predicted extracellular nuclease